MSGGAGSERTEVKIDCDGSRQQRNGSMMRKTHLNDQILKRPVGTLRRLLLRHVLVVIGPPCWLVDAEGALLEPLGELKQNCRSLLAVRLVQRDDIRNERANNDARRVIVGRDALRARDISVWA